MAHRFAEGPSAETSDWHELVHIVDIADDANGTLIVGSAFRV